MILFKSLCFNVRGKQVLFCPEYLGLLVSSCDNLGAYNSSV